MQQVMLLGSIGLMAVRLDPGLAAVALGMAPLLAVASLYFGRRLKHPATRAREAQSRLTSFVQQVLSSIAVVQSFGTAPRNRDHFATLAEDVTHWSQRGALVSSSYGMVTGLVTTAGMAVILFVGAGRVLSGQLSVGGLLVFLAYIRSLQGAHRACWRRTPP